MKLQLNGTPIETKTTTLDALLQEQGLDDAKVATAVNGAFVPETIRPSHTIKDGDLVEVLAPMQGG